jgi:hypothetical protein
LTDSNVELSFILKNTAALSRLPPSTMELFIDGTFHTRPEGWAQVLNIATLVDGHLTLLYAALMTKRYKGLYMETLRAVAGDLREKIFNVKYVHTDFEEGLMASGERAFLTGRIVGCHFHYSQALIRKLKSMGK